MEISDQEIHDPETVAGRDEQVGRTVTGRYLLPVESSLQASHHRRPNCHYPPTGLASPGDGRRRFWRYCIAFRMHDMVCDRLNPDRPEGVESHLEFDRREFDTPVRQRIDDSFREMEAGSGSRRRADSLGEDGLVSLGVDEGLSYVGRQRRLAEPGDGLFHARSVGGSQIEFEDPVGERGGDLRHQSTEIHNNSGSDPSSGFDEGFPLRTGGVAQQEDLDCASTLEFLAPQARRSDTCLVDDDEVTGSEQVCQLPERVVGHVARIEQSSCVTRIDGLLSDYLFG